MDSEYLKNTIGKALTECLAEVCLKRPLDPIEYIALWLYKHDKKLKEEAEEELLRKELERMKQEKYLEQERLEKLYLERLKLEEEENERLRFEAEAERQKVQEEVKEKEKVEKEKEKEEESKKISMVSEQDDNFLIEIGIKTHVGTDSYAQVEEETEPNLERIE